MMTRQELEGHWNEIRGRLRERWSQLTDDELNEAYGDAEQLVGVIQQKTGQSRSEIENFIEESMAESSSQYEQTKRKASKLAGQVQDRAREYANQASESFNQQYEQASHAMQDGYQQMEEAVRQRPFESVLTTFGVGLVAGVIVGLTCGRRS